MKTTKEELTKAFTDLLSNRVVYFCDASPELSKQEVRETLTPVFNRSYPFLKWAWRQHELGLSIEVLDID